VPEEKKRVKEDLKTR